MENGGLQKCYRQRIIAGQRKSVNTICQGELQVLYSREAVN